MADNSTPPFSTPEMSYSEIISASIAAHTYITAASNGIASDDIMRQVIADVWADIKVSYNQVNFNKEKLSIAILAQEGATSPRLWPLSFWGGVPPFCSNYRYKSPCLWPLSFWGGPPLLLLFENLQKKWYYNSCSSKSSPSKLLSYYHCTSLRH